MAQQQPILGDWHQLPNVQVVYSDDPISTCEVSDEVRLHAKNIFYEARSNRKDWDFVYDSVENRVKSSKFPNTVEKVLYQPKQYSWTSLNEVTLQARENKEHELLIDIISYVLKRHCFDKTPPKTDTTHYHSKKVSPKWAKSGKLTASTDTHNFYNLKR